MQSRAGELGGRLVDDPALLEKLVAICEIPGVMEGRFDDAFLHAFEPVVVLVENFFGLQ